MPIPTRPRLIVATVVNVAMVVGVIVVCVLLWNADSLVYLGSLLAASATAALLCSFVWEWAYRDKFDDIDPIDPAGTRR